MSGQFKYLECYGCPLAKAAERLIHDGKGSEEIKYLIHSALAQEVSEWRKTVNKRIDNT